jgi:hypothetical protein
MGEIKNQLAEEAAMDAQAANITSLPEIMPSIVKEAQAETVIVQSPIQAAPKPAPVIKQVAAVVPVKTVSTVPVRNHEMTITLTPGQGAEVKLEMLKGTKVMYLWTGNGGRINYDTHGDPYDMQSGFYHGYGKGRGTLDDKGELEAAFDGYHGWFWRNRTKTNVTVTLRVEGDYIAIKRVL